MTPHVKSIRELADQYGLKYSTLRKRLVESGWSLSRAVSTPLKGSPGYPRIENYYRKRVRICADCGASFYGRGGRAVACDACRSRICQQCGKKFLRRSRGFPNKFCTNKCNSLFQRTLVGELGGNWRGGVDACNRKKRIAERARKGSRAWVKEVLERDAYVCQKCGFNGNRKRPFRLHAHHIKPFGKFPDLRFEVSNGVTLCGPCHVDVHRKKFPNTLFTKLVKNHPELYPCTKLES